MEYMPGNFCASDLNETPQGQWKINRAYAFPIWKPALRVDQAPADRFAFARVGQASNWPEPLTLRLTFKV